MMDESAIDTPRQHRRRPFVGEWRKWGGNLAATAGAWLMYVVVIEAAAHAVSRDPGQRPNPDARNQLHGFIDTLSGAPPLARWDSIWYYGIANEGYAGKGPRSRFTAAFFPLYPLLMRCAGTIFGVNALLAGLWISRFALLGTLALLPVYARDRHATIDAASTAQFALLAFPSAFILIAPYAESLFCLLALAAFLLARRDRPVAAALVAYLAGLTRIHGLALVPALGVMGWQRRRAGEPWRRAALPAIGAAAAYVSLAAYFSVQFGDPLRYLSAKREYWHAHFDAPWKTLDRAMVHAGQAAARGDLGAFGVCLELPCFCLLLVAVVLFCRRREWPDAVYLACGAALSLLAGTLWGLPRFTLDLFPAIVLLAALERRCAWWHMYLVGGAIVQACLLVNYVNFRAPAP